MKGLVLLLLLASLSYARTWEAFVILPLDQKYAIMSDNFQKLIAVETKFIKVGGVYVSESICAEDPARCVVQTAPAPQPVKPAYKRTPEQCLSARQKDWDAYVWANYPNVDPNANGQAKEALLTVLSKGSQSWQAKCLRGE